MVRAARRAARRAFSSEQPTFEAATSASGVGVGLQHDDRVTATLFELLLVF
jgi:hypothetical protein